MTTSLAEPTCSSTLLHEAMFYSDPSEFVAGTVPFIREGLVAGEPALVALMPHKIELLREALGSDASEVTFVDMVGLGGNPACIIPAWRAFCAANDGRYARLRGIGEPIWAARSPVEILEAQLHEQLLNVAFAPGPELLLRCPYDTANLPEDLIAEARRSHPVLAAGGTARHSADFDGARPAVAAFNADLGEPPANAHRLEFRGESGLAAVRQMVGAHAVQAGLDPHRAADLRLAVNELVANSVAYGGGSGSLAVWREARRLVVEVRDGGWIPDVLAGRREPSPDSLTGRGLWLVNQICELVQLRSSRNGTVVRVHTTVAA
jgi:anti-sigma regulatory factor (Ser/Thr protein kinase)